MFCTYRTRTNHYSKFLSPYSLPKKQQCASLAQQMHGGRGFIGGYAFFSMLSEPGSCEMPRISLTCVCPGWQESAGWDSEGPGSIRELEVQVTADKSSACCIPPVISGRQQRCLPPPAPASPGSAQITFGSRSAPARLSIEGGKRVPGGSEARASVCLIYGPSLAWYNGSPAVSAFTSFYRMSFWDMKGGLKNTLQ